MTCPKRLALLVWLVLILALPACVSVTPTRPIRLEISAWAGVEPAQLAADMGYYAKRGAPVEMIRFSAYTDGIQALRTGRVDAGMQTLDDVIRGVAQGRDLKVVLFTDYSFGGDGIVAHNTIRTLADLRGKRVGVETGSVSHYSLLQALKGTGVSETDFEIINIPAWEIKEAFFAGTIDAGATWEPYLTEIAREGNGRVLVTSKDYPRAIVTTMVMSGDLIRTRPREAQAMVAAYFDALAYTFANPDDAYTRMGKAEGVSREEFASHVAGLQFFDLNANRTAFDANNSASMHTQTQAIIDFLFERNLIKTRLAARDILDDSFVKAIK